MDHVVFDNALHISRAKATYYSLDNEIYAINHGKLIITKKILYNWVSNYIVMS